MSGAEGVTGHNHHGSPSLSLDMVFIILHSSFFIRSSFSFPPFHPMRQSATIKQISTAFRPSPKAAAGPDEKFGTGKWDGRILTHSLPSSRGVPALDTCSCSCSCYRRGNRHLLAPKSA